MKRKAESILGIIGIVLSVLLAFLGILMLVIDINTDILQNQIDTAVSSNPSIDTADLNETLSLVNKMGWMLTISSLLGAGAGLAGLLFLKRQRIKAAGSCFLIGTAAIGLISLGVGFLPALLFLIAGILSFARKDNNHNFQT
ncbi:DUF4064 domain-containing protein [Bacillus sp. MUM 13]|uniref:DUF4064 domain-containing protein n=1 Tax=Bacillus sp. MUM 13 TaxID=1678001 RepID=UPI0008F5C4A2|nr:DUF4064 domain-containing protein [Bacillus sp. MUM 13]OIK14716.1 hypothetical protein BIV59_01890 [Bacillus sp. MUM 13]